MKRARDTTTQPTIGQYRMMLTGTGGRLSGKITTVPTCRVVRAWENKGISRNNFEHIYDIGQTGGSVCGCEDMVDTRRLISASHAPETVVIKKQCMHMEVLKALGSKFDSTPVQEYGPVAVLGDSLSVADGDTRVIVKVDPKARRYQCLGSKCQYQKFKCVHVETVHRTIRDFDIYGIDPFFPKEHAEEEETPQPERHMGSGTKCAESKQSVSLDAFVERVKQRRASSDAASQWLASGTNCVPDSCGTCETCKASWSESEVRVKEFNATLYGCYESMAVTVYERVCRCGNKKQYDGLGDGVFHYSNKTLWLHETMLEYVDLMVEARMPFNAYYKVMSRQYERRGASTLCSKSTLISSLEAFIKLLDMDYDACYRCPVCSELPVEEQVYIIDGKAMGFQWDLMKDPELREVGEQAEVIPGTKFAYITGSSKSQKLCASLRSYATGTLFADSDFNQLIRGSAEYAKELVDVLKYIKRTERDFLKCPARYRSFVYDLATPCPIACLIPRSLYGREGGLESFLDRMLDVSELSQDQRTRLMNWGSLAKLLAGWQRIPTEFAPLLKRLGAIARQLGTDYLREVTPGTTVIGNLKEDELSFFPNHPRIRKPRVFHGQDTEQTCTKNVLKSRRFSPGLFSAFCPHGICIGFEAMRKFESARVPFELFYTRFPGAPGTIIYDNACNASRYCLRREPFYFSNVLFLIDRMHQCNHVGCHSGYCMNSYPQTMKILGGTMTLGQLNSQAAEQAHAKMTLIETQTSFMGQETFMMYTKLFMALKNKEILKNM